MNNEKTIAYVLLLVLNISVTNIAYSLSTINSEQSLDSLKETVIALDTTRSKSETKLQKLVLMQNMPLKKEIREYRIFIEYLSYQIFNYCQQMNEQYGYQAISTLPCETYGNTSKGSISAKKNKTKTSEQQLSSLENDLMKSLGEFDEMLLQEDEQLAQVSRKKTKSNVSTSNKEGSKDHSGVSSKQQGNKSELEKNEKSAQNKQEQQSGKIEQSENSGSGRGKQKSTGKYKSKERRKLDEINDDIVARQLKEAAEKEPDPELKEKIWDEYYRYKKKSLSQ